MTKMTIDEAVKDINSKYGKGSFFRLSKDDVLDVEVISTGSLMIDRALGVGGYPKGRVVQILGNASSGKTTLSLHAIAEAQKNGLACAFIDAEHALDLSYAVGIGVDVDSLYINQPDNAEQALNILNAIVESGAFGLVIVDSVAALVPIRELQGESGDAVIGVLARLIGQSLRKLTGPASKTGTVVVFINQYRMNIGAMGNAPKKTTPGGMAPGFYSSVILDVMRTGTVDVDGSPGLNKTRVVVRKNKVAPPYREAEFEIIFGTGISREGELIDLCLAAGIIKRAGSWYKTKDDEALGQGKEQLRKKLVEDKELYNKYMKELEQFENTEK